MKMISSGSAAAASSPPEKFPCAGNEEGRLSQGWSQPRPAQQQQGLHIWGCKPLTAPREWAQGLSAWAGDEETDSVKAK